MQERQREIERDKDEEREEEEEEEEDERDERKRDGNEYSLSSRRWSSNNVAIESISNLTNHQTSAPRQTNLQLT